MAGLTAQQLELVALARQRAAQGVSPQESVPSGYELVQGGLANNGSVYRNTSSGQLAFKDDSYSTSDQAQIQAIMDGSTGGEQARLSQQDDIVQQHPYGARAAKFIQGVPLVGEYADEAAGAILGQQAQSGIRAAQDAMQETRPIESAGLQLAGGVAGAVTAVGAAPGMMAAAANPRGYTGMGKKILSGLGMGAALSSAEGFVSGYGAGNGGDRMSSAVNRAQWGAAIGGILGLGAPVVGSALGAIINKVRTLPAAQAAKELKVSPEAIEQIRRTVSVDDTAQGAKNLAQAGDNAMLADIGPASQGALDASISGSGLVNTQAIEAIDARAMGAYERVNTRLDDILGAPEGKITSASNVRNAAGDNIRSAYNAAYSTPIDYAAPSARQIEEVLSRIPGKDIQAAVADANRMLQWRGVDAQQIMASVDDAGRVTFSEPLNVAQLDYLKRSFDGIRRNNTDPITGMVSGDGVMAGEMARSIRDATVAASPAYREALSLASDSLGQQEAVDVGYALLRPATTRDRARASLRGLTDQEKKMAGQGVRDYIDDQLANVSAVASDANIPIREVSRMVRSLSSRRAQTNLTALLGPEQARQITDEIKRASIAINLRGATSRNSATAARLATAAGVDESAAGGVLSRIAESRGITGITGIEEIMKNLTGATPAAKMARAQGIYADIADVLTRSDSGDALRALNILRDVNINEPLSRAQASFLANTVSNVMALEAQQAATREATQ